MVQINSTLEISVLLVKLVSGLLKCVSPASQLWFLPGEDGQPCITLLTYAMPAEYLHLKKKNNKKHNDSKELHELGLIQLLSLASSR